jgi:hypothetical protein
MLLVLIQKPCQLCLSFLELVLLSLGCPQALILLSDNHSTWARLGNIPRAMEMITRITAVMLLLDKFIIIS